MSDVYTDNLYNSNDIYSNNLRCNSLVSLSDSIILNQNITLNSTFITPSIGQLGYQISGVIIANGTSITSNTLYTISSINIDAGVWMLFGQIGWKCSAITTSPNISSNTMSISFTTAIGINAIEKRETYSVSTNNTFSEQITRVLSDANANTVYLVQTLVFSGCSMITNSSKSILSATRIA